MSFLAIPTLAGQAALAAALDGGPALTISTMVVGDGNGAAITPLETQTALRRLTATVPIESSIREANKVTFDAILDENVGGFTIREAGLMDPAGQLLFVASVPETEKLTSAQNAYDVLTLGLIVIVSASASVYLSPPADSLVSIAKMVRAPWITVDSATIPVPAANPAAGATHLVPPDGAGPWAGNAGNLAQHIGGKVWVFKSVPRGHLINCADDGKFLIRTDAGWSDWFGTLAEHLAGQVDKPALIRGVQAMIDAAAPDTHFLALI